MTQLTPIFFFKYPTIQESTPFAISNKTLSYTHAFYVLTMPVKHFHRHIQFIPIKQIQH
jgi:hypothetical protein